MAFGSTPTSTTALSANQFPASAVASPDTPSGNLTAVAGAPGAYQDSNSNQATAVMMSIATPRIVQSAHNVTGGAGKTLTCAFVNNNVKGNSIVVCVGLGEVEGAGITLALTDTNANTYTQAIKASQSTTLEATIFYATYVAAGANTVTVTIAGGSSSNTAIAVEVYEVYGLIAQTPGALDQTATGSNAGSTAPATAAVTPLVPSTLAFAAVSAAGGTITAGTNWTLDSGTLSPTGGNLVSFGSESLALATMSALTPAATLGTSNAWTIAAATFKPVIVPIEGTVTIGGVLAGLSQANQIPVSNSGQQGKLTLSLGSLTANSDNSITFSGNATVARRIRIQNESTGTIYWDADATASTGSPSLPSPAANQVMAEWINNAITTLHIWIPTGGTTVLNGAGGVKISAWA